MAGMRFDLEKPALLLATWLLLAAAARANGDGKPLLVEVFGEAGCQACETVRREVLPEINARWGSRIRLVDRDVFEKTNYLALVAYRDRFGVKDDEPVSVVVSGKRYLGGVTQIAQGLSNAVAESVMESAPSASASQPSPSASAISSAYSRFGWGLVLAAGLADGFNPCAIGTLVFFVSLLAAGKAGKRRMAMAGGAFCLGVFVTYVALGLGLLRVWRAAESLPVARLWFRIGLSGLLVVLAALSIQDAIAYRKTGDASDVKLKLPRRLQQASHRLARKGSAARWLLPGCALMGVGVTVIEAVCTGQAYLPALAFMSSQGSVRAFSMLLAYNAMFVLPLVAILVAALLGWRSMDMAAWTKKEVVAAKVALAAVFVALGVALWVPV